MLKACHYNIMRNVVLKVEYWSKIILMPLFVQLSIP